MPDLRQEIADVEQAIERLENEGGPPTAQATAGKVKLRHPHTRDVREVDATQEALVPLMGLGYQQVRGE